MDGIKTAVAQSLQLKLSLVLSLWIIVVTVMAGSLSFRAAYHQAHEFQDDVLRQVAGILVPGNKPLHHRAGPVIDSDDEESRVLVQRLDEPVPTPNNVDQTGLLNLPHGLMDGLHSLRIQGEHFRVLVVTRTNGERIAVAQEAGFRDEIARASALRTVMPLIIFLPPLLWILSRVIHSVFEPIVRVSRELDQRREQDLGPVQATAIPKEVMPFVTAINRLFSRVSQTLEDQRRFIADAAHELRSPLTALSLQAERLAQAPMSNLALERLVSLRAGIERNRMLLEQLLTLARTQYNQHHPQQKQSILKVLAQTLEDLMPLAERKNIEIEVEGDPDLHVEVPEADLNALFKNLLDNAVRYSPEYSRVHIDILRSNAGVMLCIRDEGPGIAPEEQVRVFDPFYRTLGNGQMGSGLGLAIVKSISERLNASINLAYTNPELQRGLAISLYIPDQGSTNLDLWFRVKS